MKQCPECGKMVADHVKFCTFCGTKLPETAGAPSEITCPVCSRPTDAGSDFCIYCGSRISGAKSAPSYEDEYTEQDYDDRYSGAGYDDRHDDRYDDRYDDRRVDDPYNGRGSSRKGPGILIPVIIILCALVAAVGGFIAYTTFGGKSSKETDAAAETEYQIAAQDTEAAFPETVPVETQEAATIASAAPADTPAVPPAPSEAAAVPAPSDAPAVPVPSEAPASETVLPPGAGTPAAPAAENTGDYIIPDSSERYLTESDIAGLSKKEIWIAKNEIYARHGRKFKNQELQDYFNGKSWYHGTIVPDDFADEDHLNEYERKNTVFLRDHES